MEEKNIVGYLYAKVDAHMRVSGGINTRDVYIESKTFKLPFDKNEVKFFIANMENYKEFIKMNIKYIEWQNKLYKKFEQSIKFEWTYTYESN